MLAPRSLFASAAGLFVLGGVIYSLVFLGEQHRYPDEAHYQTLAAHLAAGNGYTFDGTTPTAYRPPGYAFALALPGAFSDSIHLARTLHYCLLAIACALLGRLVPSSLTRSPWSAASMLLAMVVAYPVLIYTAGTVYPQTLLAALLSAIIVLLNAHDNSLVKAAAIGLLAAFAVEVSPTVLVILPVAVLSALASSHWSHSRVIVIVACMSVVIGGWFLRNLIVLDAPIVFSTNLAESIDAVRKVESDFAEPEAGGDLAGVRERLLEVVVSPIGYLERVLDFFAWRNELKTASESSSIRDLVMLATYSLLIGLVLIRLLLMLYAPLSGAEWMILVLYLGTALFHAFVFTRIRYRLPFDFLLLLPALSAVLVMAASRRTAPKKTTANSN